MPAQSPLELSNSAPGRAQAQPKEEARQRDSAAGERSDSQEGQGRKNGFLAKFGALLLEQVGASERSFSREPLREWQHELMRMLLQMNSQGMISPEEALDWMFSKFPRTPRKPDEPPEDYAKRVAAQPARSVGAALLAERESTAHEEFWLWIETASNFSGRFRMTSQQEPAPLFLGALRVEAFGWAAKWAERTGSSDWSDEWVPEALLSCVFGGRFNSLREEDLSDPSRVALAPRSSAAQNMARVLRALIERERAVHGSKQAAMAARQRNAADFLKRRSKPKSAIGNFRRLEELHWAMSAWAANGFLSAPSVVEWLRTHRVQCHKYNDLPASGLCAMTARVSQNQNVDAQEGLGAARGFWEWMISQQDWDGATRSEGEDDLDAAQWAFVNRNASLMAFLATRAPAGAIDAQWAQWETLMRSSGRARTERTMIECVGPVVRAAAERHEIACAAQASRLDGEPAASGGDEELGPKPPRRL